MAKWEQYEVWAQSGNQDKWDMIAAFPSFEVASGLLNQRGKGVRLVRAQYEGETRLELQVMAEIGNTRTEP